MRVRFADCTFDSSAHALYRAGARAPLTPKAFALLEALLAARPAAVSKDELYLLLWPDVTVEPGNLHNLVVEVRDAIGDSGRELIRTVHRVGYAFAGAAENVERSAVRIETADRAIDLVEGENVIGRAQLPNRDVSREHARIVVTGTRATLEDLGSKNGTWLGRRRIDAPVELSDGDEVSLGRTRIVVRIGRRDQETVTAAPEDESSG